MLKVSELYIHPIKSLGGISLKTAEVTDRGLKHDRRLLLVDENNCFFTQRDFPRMTLLKTNILDGILEVSDKNNPTSKIEIPIKNYTDEKLQVKIWNDTVEANVVNANINKWFSDFIGIECKLVYMPNKTKREVSKEQARDNEIVSFADGFPFLIIGQSALDDLNRRLTNPVPITNFRPNIVFTGGTPFDEDNWGEIRIGEMTFFAVKPCARCVITTIDQKAATKNKEPLATLSTYRRSGSKILFGENLIHEGTGKISVGDEIKIISHKK
ncbi:MAG: MOSC domain-containing protein [Ignavibacteriae bacterium]|nr:MOSC domain-containing protein [Ignavibacteriota bacterium]NOG98435.1 MOSC domain-containing protein [Ignavibacteriota bacterium]